MTETPQPSGSGDVPQEPLPAQPEPQPGSGQEQPSFRTWLGGLDSPVARPRRRRTGLIIGIAAALVVLVGAGIAVGLQPSSGSNSPHKSSGAGIRLPGVLLGLPKYVGPLGQVTDARLAREVTTSSKGTLVHVVAAEYGDRPGFAIGVGRFCGSCVPSPASRVVQAMVRYGFADARSFPPGPGARTLTCGTLVRASGTLIDCKWATTTTGGEIAYYGFASGLADAAAKTRQILAIIYH